MSALNCLSCRSSDHQLNLGLDLTRFSRRPATQLSCAGQSASPESVLRQRATLTRPTLTTRRYFPKSQTYRQPPYSLHTNSPGVRVVSRRHPLSHRRKGLARAADDKESLETQSAVEEILDLKPESTLESAPVSSPSRGASPLPVPGEILHDRYRVVRVLGEGGSGTTYEAEDLNNPISRQLETEASDAENPADEVEYEKVALKALSLRGTANWKSLSLFEREAKTLAGLQHPSIPEYVDYFEEDTASDRVFYLVQAVAQGKSLQQMVDEGWRADDAEVTRIIGELLEIVKYLESQRPPVVHRDIKPSNIVVDGYGGRVSLVDFGAAATAVQEADAAMRSTIVGTFGYMSPEQFRGSVTTASDLYAVGGCVVFLLTGKPPSAFAQPGGLGVDLRGIQAAPALRQLAERLLEPLPDQRPASASEALSILCGEGGAGREVGGAVAPRGKASRAQLMRQPAGSRVEVSSSGGRLRFTIPAAKVDGDTVTMGAFAVAWNAFTAVWTVGALAGGPLFAAFSLPFWAAGAGLAKQAFWPVLEETVLELDDDSFSIEYSALGRVKRVEGSVGDLVGVELNTDMVVNGEPQTVVTVQEGVNTYPVGGGLKTIEKEWLVARINAFLDKETTD